MTKERKQKKKAKEQKEDKERTKRNKDSKQRTKEVTQSVNYKTIRRQQIDRIKSARAEN